MAWDRLPLALVILMTAGACTHSAEKPTGVAIPEPPSADGPATGCRSRGPTRLPGDEIEGTREGDFDGDGRRDTVSIYNPTGDFPDDGAYRIRIEFGAGGTTDEELPVGGRVAGVDDVNEDARDEIIVDLGGNTGFSVSFATVVSCRVAVAKGPEGLPAGFGYYGHSTTYPGSVGTHCLDGNGDGRFDRVIQVSSEPVGFADVNGDGQQTAMDYWEGGPKAADHFSWERRDYVLEADEFHLVNQTNGLYERPEGQLELSNDLVCEPAQPK